MISINKYGQNIDLSNVQEINGKKSYSLDNIDSSKTLLIRIPQGVKFVTTLQDENLKIDFTDSQGNIFELILKNMAEMLVQNDGDKLIEIIREETNESLASITDLASALEAAAAGGEQAQANTNSDSGRVNEFETDGLDFNSNTYPNSRVDVPLNFQEVEGPVLSSSIEPIDETPIILNNAPIIEAQEASLFENTIIQGQLTASDIDTAFTNLTFSTTETIDGFTLNPDGSYTFDANNYDYLAEGEILELAIPITVTDDFNASASSVLNIKITGTNDAPVVVTAGLVTTINEDSMGLFDGNRYKVLKVEDIFASMKVSDVDSYEASVELVDKSAKFVVTEPGSTKPIIIDGTVIKLTQAFIDANGIVGATAGDFIVYAKEIDQLAKGDNLEITFEVKANDGIDSSVGSTKITVNVSGDNDAPVAKDILIELIENQLTNTSIDNTTLTVGVNSDKSLNNNITDSDVLDTHTFARWGTSLSLTFTTSSSGLVHSVQNNQIEYIRDVAAKFVSIPEIATVLSSITNVNMLILIDQLQNASSVSQIAIILNSVGITPSITSAGLNLTIADASILETKGLLTIDLSSNDGSYSVSSPLFNNLGVTDTVSLSFDYIVTDSENESDIGTVTINIKGSNDALMIENVTISTHEDALVNSTKLEIGIDNPYSLTNFVHDIDVTDDFYFEKADGSKIGLTLLTKDPALLVAFQTNNVAYIKNIALQLLSIPEVTVALSTTISEPNILALINSLNSANTVMELFTIINHINGISASMTTAGLSLSIEDVSILVDKGLLSINIEGEGSYTVESLLFNNMSINDSISLSFDYIAKDSGGATTDPRTITVNITGTNDAPTTSIVYTQMQNDDTSKEYKGQLSAKDVDLNDTLTYSIDNTSVNVALTISNINGLSTLTNLNTSVLESAFQYIKPVVTNFIATGDLSGLLTLNPQTIATAKTAVVTLQGLLNSNSDLKDSIVLLKDFIVANKDSIIENTSLVAQDIVLLQGLLTQENLTALVNLYEKIENFLEANPALLAAAEQILADNVITNQELNAITNGLVGKINSFKAQLSQLVNNNEDILNMINVSQIIEKLQEVVTIDSVNNQISIESKVTPTLAGMILTLDPNTGEYIVNNAFAEKFSSLGNLEISFDYIATDSQGATDSSKATILITTEEINDTSVSLNDNGVLSFSGEKDIDLGNILENISNSIEIQNIDSIDLSNSEHILSNLTIKDFEEMVADDSSNTLVINGENDDKIKLDLSIWLKDENDKDINSIDESEDDGYITYTAIGTAEQTLTLLIDKDIVVENI